MLTPRASAILSSAPVHFIVHGLPHLRAALIAGREAGCAIVALSGPGASGYAGAGWWQALAAEGRAEFPDVPLTAILDCGDRAGDAMAAFACGVTDIIYSGHPEALIRLRGIAEAQAARVHHQRPEAFDLGGHNDPLFAARRQCGLAQ